MVLPIQALTIAALIMAWSCMGVCCMSLKSGNLELGNACLVFFETLRFSVGTFRLLAVIKSKYGLSKTPLNHCMRQKGCGIDCRSVVGLKIKLSHCSGTYGALFSKIPQVSVAAAQSMSVLSSSLGLSKKCNGNSGPYRRGGFAWGSTVCCKNPLTSFWESQG